MNREVAIYDSSFVKLFSMAHTMKASVRPVAQNMEHPVADGSVITDHRIIKPTVIVMEMVLDPSDYKNTYDQIAGVFKSGELLTVSTRSGVYTNMIIDSIPNEETAQKSDTITLIMTLKQVIFVRPQYGQLSQADVSNPSDSTTVDKGVVQAKSVAAAAFDSLVGLLR